MCMDTEKGASVFTGENEGFLPLKRNFERRVVEGGEVAARFVSDDYLLTFCRWRYP